MQCIGFDYSLSTTEPTKSLWIVHCMFDCWPVESACVHACSVLAGGVRTDAGVKNGSWVRLKEA